MYEYKPTYIQRLTSNLNTQIVLTTLISTSLVLTLFSVGVSNRIIRILAGATTLTLSSISRMVRRELIKSEWEIELHRQLSNAEFQRQLLNNYAQDKTGD